MDITVKITDKERLVLMKALSEKNQRSVKEWQKKQRENTVRGLCVIAGKKENRIMRLVLNDTLEEYYKVLGCSTIDIPARRIGGKYYAVVCDDEALYNPPVIPTFKTADSRFGTIFGSIFICNFGENGSLASLTDDDIQRISQHIRRVMFLRTAKNGERKLECRRCVIGTEY